MSQRNDYFWRSVLFVYAVAVSLVALYFVPDELMGYELKRIDLLSQLRIQQHHEAYDSLLSEVTGLSQEHAHANQGGMPSSITEEASVATDTISIRHVSMPSDNALHSGQTSDTSPKQDTLVAIQDFSTRHDALAHFYSALDRANSGQLGRPVRIAVLGDSFIEGDIFTAPLRELLQQRWGGSGVGWMPMYSQVAGFRTSIGHQSKGWSEHTQLQKSKRPHLMTGRSFTPEVSNFVRYTLPKGKRAFNEATLYYTSQTEITAMVKLDTISYTYTLPSTGGALEAFTLGRQPARELSLSLTSDGACTSYGIGLESSEGVVVDNYSLRGSSGLVLGNISEVLSRRYAELRPYDLIVLEYGLNVASSKQTDYSSWSRQMSKIIAKLRSYYPSASFLLMGVSDRVERSDGGMRTMIGVLAMHKAQEQLARNEGIAFWSILRGMYELGGMETMMRNHQVAKDYTHVSYAGGKQLARILYEAMMADKQQS